jgi:hypothetical protein
LSKRLENGELYREENKIFLIILTDTIVHKNAVMIHPFDATFANAKSREQDEQRCTGVARMSTTYSGEHVQV